MQSVLSAPIVTVMPTVLPRGRGREQPEEHRTEAVGDAAGDFPGERVLADEGRVRGEHVVGAGGDDPAVGERHPAGLHCLDGGG